MPHRFQNRRTFEKGLFMSLQRSFAAFQASSAAILTAAVLFSGGFAQAEPYRDEARHFTLTLPADWVVMSADRVEKINEFTQQRMPNAQLHYDTGFQPRGKSAGSFPYILVQSLRQRMSGATYEDVEKALAKDFKSEVKKVKDAFADLMADAAVGQLTLERSGNRFLMPLEINATGIGKVRGLSAGMIGSEGIVMLHGYVPDAEYQQYLPAFRALIDSFHYDEGYTFVPQSPTKDVHPGTWDSTWRGLFDHRAGWIGGGVNGAIVGGLIGLFVGCVIALLKKLKRGQRK
jgi:hypothetical protein